MWVGHIIRILQLRHSTKFGIYLEIGLWVKLVYVLVFTHLRLLYIRTPAHAQLASILPFFWASLFHGVGEGGGGKSHQFISARHCAGNGATTDAYFSPNICSKALPNINECSCFKKVVVQYI